GGRMRKRACVLVGLLSGCTSEQPTPAPRPPSAPLRAAPKPAESTRSSVPFDLGRVMRQVHFAFRPDPNNGQTGWTSDHASYGVHANADHWTLSPGQAGRRGTAASFRTTAVGRAGTSLEEASAEVAEDGSLLIDRGVAVERLRNGEDGLEQSW